MSELQKMRLCRIADNLYFAVIWYSWLIPEDSMRMLVIALLFIDVMLHLLAGKWKLQVNMTLQSVLALISWFLCFMVRKTVPDTLSYMALLAIVILILSVIEACRQKKNRP